MVGGESLGHVIRPETAVAAQLVAVSTQPFAYACPLTAHAQSPSCVCNGAQRLHVPHSALPHSPASTRAQPTLAEVRSALAFMTSLGVALPPGLTAAAAARHKQGTEAALTADPYKALQGLPGYSWEMAEQVAAQLGHDLGAASRCAAALLHTLQRAANVEGHTYLPWQSLQQGGCVMAGRGLLRVRTWQPSAACASCATYTDSPLGPALGVHT